MNDLPLAQGFAFAAWAVENNGLCAVERTGPGYIAQEVSSLKFQVSSGEEAARPFPA